MDLTVFAQGLAFSILIGALVGIEREHARKKAKGPGPIFGLRTMIFFSVLGFLFSIIYNALLVGSVIALIIAISGYLANAFLFKRTGVTTTITSLIVFLLGYLIGQGGYTNYFIASSTAIIMTLLLAAKKKLVSFTKALTSEEIFSALKFGILAFVILPLLPNKYIDPYNLINPFKIWYVIILVSLIELVSYIFLKLFSEKGLYFSSFFGGWINGSATVFQSSTFIKRKVKKNVVLASVFLACISGILSDIAVIFFVFRNIPLLKNTLPVQVTGIFLLSLFFYNLFSKEKYKEKRTIKLKSPFAITPALEFGIIYLALIVFGKILNSFFGVAGMVPLIIVGSLYSSSTVIASLAQLSFEGVVSIKLASVFVILSSVISLLIKTFWVYIGSLNKELSKKTFIYTFVTSSIMLFLIFVL